MNAMPAPRFGTVRAAALGAGAGGTIDLIFACTFNGLVHDVAPQRVLQSIASGLLGRAAFDGGVATAVLGTFAHYAILFVAATIFIIAGRRLTFLRERPWLWGSLFGAAIFLVMHCIVLPLSAAPPFRSTPFSASCDFLVHLFGIGLPIALIARRA